MSELMRDDACREAEAVTDHVQVIADLTRMATLLLVRARSRPSAGSGSRQRKKRSRCTRSRPKASTGTMRSVLRFSDGHMNRPLVRRRGAQAVIGEVDAFADSHAGRTE